MAKKELPHVNVSGTVRRPNPRDERPDGSIMLQAVGGPYDRKVVRVYPPFDDPIQHPLGGVYQLSGPIRARGKDVLLYLPQGVER